MTAVDLDVLERRVGEKWMAAAARMPRWELPEFDMAAWDEAMKTPLPPGTPQFPREQWASYPAKRTAALIAAEHLLDFADELSDEQWMQVCMVMQYGGKTRIA